MQYEESFILTVSSCLIFYGSSGEERQLLNGFLDFIEKDKLLFGGWLGCEQ
jgi:hypothetical protein